MKQETGWGGARAGAGRKPVDKESIAVNWRISPQAKEWILTQAKEQGEPIAVILDELIRSFEESANA